MRSVVPFLVACVLAVGCATDEEQIGTTQLRVLALGEGEHLIEATIGPGESENIAFTTADDTLMVVVENELIAGDGVVLTGLDDVPTRDNADCVGDASGSVCSYTLPGEGALIVGASAGPDTVAMFRIRVSIRKTEGISTSP